MQLQLGLQCDVCGVVGLVNGSVYLICLVVCRLCPDSGSVRTAQMNNIV